MVALKAFSISSMIPTAATTTHHQNKKKKKPIIMFNHSSSLPTKHYLHRNNKTKPFTSFKLFSSSVLSTNDTQEEEEATEEGKFNWYSHWYPVAPVCDLDKREPRAKKILGLDIVVWWDKNQEKWQIFDDACPHRLAPLSEGRIDQWGRLQCVYHGWCFDGAGNCKFIPQAPPDGPPIHTFKKACAAAYPSMVQNGIVWFWPSTDPQFTDIETKNKPPYFSELDDPSFTTSMGTREIPYGYEVLIENLMDPSHVPYAHYGIMKVPRPADREGGRPMEIIVKRLDINGFDAKQENGFSKFIPPCVFYAGFSNTMSTNGSASSVKTKEEPSKTLQRQMLLIFICIPVSPGNSRLIWAFPRNFGVWIDRVLPRWMFHVGQNLILDSDLYLLHLEERKLINVGPTNWQKACFVPTKADALVVAFRKWIRKYSDGEVDWGTNFSRVLAPTPPKEQLMDRYWSHVVNCSSCRMAVKGLKVLEVALQIISVASIGIVAIKQASVSVLARNAVVLMAVLCFAASKWLSRFIYKSFYFHDYNHALR